MAADERVVPGQLRAIGPNGERGVDALAELLILEVCPAEEVDEIVVAIVKRVVDEEVRIVDLRIEIANGLAELGERNDQLLLARADIDAEDAVVLWSRDAVGPVASFGIAGNGTK